MKKILLITLVLFISFCGCDNYSNQSENFVPAYQPVKSVDQYEVKGVDVSKYQGDVDWEKMVSQNISFAYIKATQGENNIDPNYKHNITQASKAGIKVGTYHYFSLDCKGLDQANFFINNSIYQKGFLPPALDIELEDYHTPSDLDINDITQNIREMLNILEKKYKTTPIIYTNSYAFKTLLYEGFEKYPVWYANYTNNPNVPDKRQWLFWQYSKNGVLYDKNNRQKPVDLDVFYGSNEEFKRLFG